MEDDYSCCYYCPHLLVMALNKNKEWSLLLFFLISVYIFFFIATLNNSDIRITVSYMRLFGNDFVFSQQSC